MCVCARKQLRLSLLVDGRLDGTIGVCALNVCGYGRDDTCFGYQADDNFAGGDAISFVEVTACVWVQFGLQQDGIHSKRMTCFGTCMYIKQVC